MKLKSFALCAIAAAVTGCTIDTDTSTSNNTNSLGSIALSGTVKEAETLSVSVADADGISNAITYIWYADGSVITDATSASFTLTSEQIGTNITVQALYTDDGGISESHISDATSAVEAIAYPATASISGDAIVGETLTASVTDDNGIDSNAVIAYAWSADGQTIDGATASTYTLTDAEFGTVITVTTTFDDARGFSESATSSATALVSRINTQGSVAIQGTPTVGNTLTAMATDADGIPTSISYQWLADGQDINGETNNTIAVLATYVGQVISVKVTYTDEHGFSENNTSNETQAVTNLLVDAAGSLSIQGTSPYLADAELTANLTDNNGINEANVTYSWSADGNVIANATSKTFTPTDYAGAIISVSASYTDNDGFMDTLSDHLDTQIYTAVVGNVTTLKNTLTSGLADGDVVGLSTGVYADINTISLNSAITLQALEGEDPAITGDLCIHIEDGVDGAKISGLTFSNIDTSVDSLCETDEDAIIYSEGDNFVFSHNTMGGDQDSLNETEPEWIMLKGVGALIERNTFIDRNNAEKGSIIKMSSASSDHVIQYNLFKGTDVGADKNPNYAQSSLHLFNVGSTTGTDAALNANFTIRYNRVENFVTGRRMMRVQTSGATIHGNTIINTNGGIALEDGGFNTVSDNIIIRTTNIADGNDRPAGIIATPLGHTISNNYIAGIRSTNKEAGGIVFTVNPFSVADGGAPNPGNQAVLTGAGDFTVTVTNNTVLNSTQPIVFSTEVDDETGVGDCDDATIDTSPLFYPISKNFLIVNFTANLIANGLNEDATTQGLAFGSEDISSDHAFEYDCDLVDHTNSLFSNNFGFTDSYVEGNDKNNWVDIRKINGNGEFDTDGAIDQSPADNGKEVPHLVTAVNTLIETDPNENQSVAGAKGLYYIQDADVGAGSTWTAE